MSKLVVVLISPLCHGIHEFVVNILTIHNEIMINMENEVPWVGEGF